VDRFEDRGSTPLASTILIISHLLVSMCGCRHDRRNIST
jgi:hypothetical protein